MRKVMIDTSCLISFISDRNLDQQMRIASLFNEARRLKKMIVCHHHVVGEFVYVLTSVYSLKSKIVQQMVADLISMPGIMFTSDVDMQTILSFWPEHIPDYGDAILAAYCKQTKGTKIASFDKKFNDTLNRIGLPVQIL